VPAAHELARAASARLHERGNCDTFADTGVAMFYVISTVIILALGVAQLAIVFTLAATGRRQAPGAEPLAAEQMRRFYRWGIFYINAADPRGVVPKLYGLGVTVNFRNVWWARLLVGLFCAMLMLVVIIAVAGSLHH
jgi:uncharacterized membrane protein